MSDNKQLTEFQQQLIDAADLYCGNIQVEAACDNLINPDCNCHRRTKEAKANFRALVKRAVDCEDDIVVIGLRELEKCKKLGEYWRTL